jgi:uncharacterized protein (UPF0147 family)
MAGVRIGARNAADVGRILRQIATGAAVPVNVRENATYWCSVMRRTMDRRDLRTVAYLLADMSTHRSLSHKSQREARYWATYLEAQL